MPATAEETDGLVFCHDIGRAIVSRVLRKDCEGAVVDEATARDIAGKRVEALRNALAKPPPRSPGLPGTRPTGSGSGFFVGPGGQVVTNAHVAADCKALAVVPEGDKPYEAELIAADRARDLALLTASVQPRRVARFSATSDLAEPDQIFVVGYPLLGMATIRVSIVTGYVTAQHLIGRAATFPLVADVHRGHSGSPVLDHSGNVIGVINAKVDSVRLFRRTGQVVTDQAFGISGWAVQDFLRKNDVKFETADARSRQSAELILDVASEFVARVLCWK